MGFSFLLQRLLQACIVMLVISALAFAVQQELGDPLRALLGQSVSEAEREALRQELGLNDPAWQQYARFLGKAVQGDLGTSYFYKEPVTQVIADKLAASMELVLAATLIIVGLSVPLGVLTAVRPRSLGARLIMAGSLLGISVPVFLTAILLVAVFSIQLGWLPAFGRGDTVAVLGLWHSGLFTADGLIHLLLPSLALASIMLPLFIRLIRAEVMDALTSDYVTFARARGLSERRVIWRHAFRNALVPVTTVGGLQLGVMLAYTLLTESVFQWPGLGLLFLEAVHRADTPLIVGYLLFVGLVFVLLNTVIDLLYRRIDPRLKAQP